MKDEQRMMDEKIVAEMDQKVLDQQNTLEKAGVPGFYITTIPQVAHNTVISLCCPLSFSLFFVFEFHFSYFFLMFFCLHLTGSDDADELIGVDPEVTTKRFSVWITALSDINPIFSCLVYPLLFAY